MKVSEIARHLEADILACPELLDMEVFSACGSDMMSDVLAFVKNQSVLITGLCNPQVVRTAEMMDMHCIVFVRGKIPDQTVVELATEHKIVILTTKMRMYPACGILYSHGLREAGCNV